MNIPFFTPKAAASTLIGVGSMGGGGGAVYLYQMPKNWKDLLIKEGYVFLSADEDYKGMFNDHKDDGEIWKKEEGLKDANENDVHTKAQQYCSTKLNESLPSASDGNYSSTKQKLIAFCTTEGIKTVKARLIQNKQSNWIDPTNGEDKWKAVFAVYRYSDEFIKWLKADDAANSSLSHASDVSEYAKLQSACQKLLAKPWREITDHQLFNYGSWWCVDLGYTTIKEKIQQTDKGWNELDQNGSEWANLKSKWENTEEVKTWANKAAGNSSDTSLTEDSLKKLCEANNVSSQLKENESYKDKYRVIKTVCGQGSSS